MQEVREVGEVERVKDSAEKRARVAAFFDLDGTLVPLPSLEKRFFQALRYRREISRLNYLLWIKEALRLLPRGFPAVAHANKMYLRGVPSLPYNRGFIPPSETGADNRDVFSAHTSGRPAKFFAEGRASQAGGQASATPPKRVRRNPRCPVPRFFEDALECAASHASRGHILVIVSGTLEPLARAAALHLQAALSARGFAAEIHVCATRLEEVNGRWTGKILGEPTFGAAKARAVRKIAKELGLDLERSCAYGDSALDEAMLAVVGKRAAVNPSRKLTRLARRHGWPVLRWKERALTPRTQNPQKIEPNHAACHPDTRGAASRSLRRRDLSSTSELMETTSPTKPSVLQQAE
jgi:phosphoserine phosphatase